MDKKVLAKAIYQRAKIEGNFVLRSGLRATEYFERSSLFHVINGFLPSNLAA